MPPELESLQIQLDCSLGRPPAIDSQCKVSEQAPWSLVDHAECEVIRGVELCLGITGRLIHFTVD